MIKINVSKFDVKKIPSAKEMRFGIVVSEWNSEITDTLYKGAIKTLLACGCKKENILRINVPGSFELIHGAQLFAEHQPVDAVICIGCVIQGETRHFEFICNSVANGLMNLGIKYQLPFIFGVLTTDNHQQAKDRSSGKFGNKGVEAAVTAIKMVAMEKNFKN